MTDKAKRFSLQLSFVVDKKSAIDRSVATPQTATKNIVWEYFRNTARGVSVLSVLLSNAPPVVSKPMACVKPWWHVSPSKA